MNARQAVFPADALPAAGAAILEFDSVSFSYGERIVLDRVSLSVEGGMAVGLLGPNGSGKSTLLALAAGLKRPREGTIRLLGRPPGPEARQWLGVLFQDSGLDPLMTVVETLSLQGRLFGLGGHALREAVDVSMRRVNLAERAGSRVGTLSGGMRRRVALSRALMTGPRVVLLDEPGTGLDPESRAEMWGYLREARRAGTALLVASQDVAEVERECQLVALMYAGRIVRLGTVAELREGLRHDAVRVEYAAIPEGLVEEVRSWPDVGSVTVVQPVIHVVMDRAAAFVPRLLSLSPEGIRDIRIHEATLEDAYFRIVGHELREPAE